MEALYEEDDVSVVYVLPYRHYLTFSVCPIEVGVKVAQVGLIPSLCGLWKGVSRRECFG